jgi:uncharacterized membrane protein YqhA
MAKIIAFTRYLIITFVVILLFLFIASLGWGIGKAIYAIIHIVTSMGKASTISLEIIGVVDSVLITTVVYILAASLYKIFINEINIPETIIAKNITELKIRLSSLIILVIAIKFLEYLFSAEISSMDLLFVSIACAIISVVLIFFIKVSYKEP